MLRKIPRVDALVILFVSAVTVYKDLAVAVVAGTLLSAVSFAWKQSTTISARVSRPAAAADGAAAGGDRAAWPTYKIQGPLFFGSTGSFGELFDAKGDPDDVVVDFADSRVCDHSALEAINGIAGRYAEAGKRVHLLHLSSDCAALLRRLNGYDPAYELIETNPREDPVYEVAEDGYADVPVPLSPELDNAFAAFFTAAAF